MERRPSAHLVHAIVRIPIDCWVSIVVFLAPAVATAIARTVLGGRRPGRRRPAR